MITRTQLRVLHFQFYFPIQSLEQSLFWEEQEEVISCLEIYPFALISFGVVVVCASLLGKLYGECLSCSKWDSARCRAEGKALGELGGGSCEVKSAEPARVKGPRNSAELPLIALYDGIVGLLALKPYPSIASFCL